MTTKFNKIKKSVTAAAALFLLISCASKILEEEKQETFHQNKEFENLVKVKELPATDSEKAQIVSPEAANQVKRAEKKSEIKKQKENVSKADGVHDPLSKKQVPDKKSEKVKETTEPKAEQKTAKKRLPPVEDSEGFVGRRPEVDPYVLGERVTMAVKYFKVAAGYMTFEVRPMAEVNDRLAYHFAVIIKSSSVFSMFYKVDDWAETFLDYEELVPLTMGIHVNESKQARDIRSYFDWKKLEATFWEKKVTKEKGEEEKKQVWKLAPYSQNVVSAIFYLRNFNLRVGKTIAFPVSDDGKNFVFSGKVLRKEVLTTEAGTFNCFVIKPELKLDGVFKPVGDVYLWITDDKYRTMVRLESKIKIGTIIAEATKIERPGL
ncbi:MAG: DUF3108 domain-containing protein [Pseudobdellovibrionaceae bacterium]|nr:DUF3108 domain-containing protein [Bdellovibrionales bacterium]USN48892.1 MAG: DUF3108 domain-containing protein [Pseudobdellovibrionaceae bacterium]